MHLHPHFTPYTLLASHFVHTFPTHPSSGGPARRRGRRYEVHHHADVVDGFRRLSRGGGGGSGSRHAGGGVQGECDRCGGGVDELRKLFIYMCIDLESLKESQESFSEHVWA